MGLQDGGAGTSQPAPTAGAAAPPAPPAPTGAGDRAGTRVGTWENDSGLSSRMVRSLNLPPAPANRCGSELPVTGTERRHKPQHSPTGLDHLTGHSEGQNS